jgi:3-phosphoshikimate 1-carboxyvinyltransferase
MLSDDLFAPEKLLIRPPLIYPDGISISLPLSKSIANRLMIINFLSNTKVDLEIPESSDSQIMFDLLSRIHSEKTDHENQNYISRDVAEYSSEDAGTVFRFLSALFSCIPGKRILTGSRRMLQRPCGPLIDSLIEIGAKCSYIGKHGFPPVVFEGRALNGGEIEIEASVSSQFISALMMIAPLMNEGLVIHLKGAIVSFPYILLTASLMRRCGVEVKISESVIRIPNSQYKALSLSEADWSAASYWYALVAISPMQMIPSTGILLKGLSQQTSQGDGAVLQIFEQLGVDSTWEDEGLRLKKSNQSITKFNINLKDYPDLTPAIAVTCAALGLQAELAGLNTLVIKESNRLIAIRDELLKQGYNCSITDHQNLVIIPGNYSPKTAYVETYNDHRIAMAMSLLCVRKGELAIKNPSVVAKSYPKYWEDLKSAGFVIY